jgi:hypothetical protein
MQVGEYADVRSPDAAQRVALAERCAAEPGSRLLATRRKPGSRFCEAALREELRAASRPGHVIALRSSFEFQTAKPPHSRGAVRPRFAISFARPARGDGAVGGARAPMGTPRGGINVPTSHGKAPCAPKARRSASQRSTNHQAVDRSGAPVRPAFALSVERIASRKQPLVEQDAIRISEVWGTGIRNVKKYFRKCLQARVPGAVRHSSCRSAEPGPYQAPAFVTAPALQRTASRRATRCAASGARMLLNSSAAGPGRRSAHPASL